jgi:hypothetical protein
VNSLEELEGGFWGARVRTGILGRCVRFETLRLFGPGEGLHHVDEHLLVRGRTVGWAYAPAGHDSLLRLFLDDPAADECGLNVVDRLEIVLHVELVEP